MSPQARLGAFVLVAIVTLGLVSSKISGMILFKQKSHIVEAEFADLMGLEVQAPVRMAGVKVGIVQDILLKNNRAVARIALNPDVRLPASTRASIVSRGLVGDKYLSLSAKPGDTEWLPDGATIPSDPSGDFNVLMRKLSVIADDFGGLSHQLGEAFKGKNGVKFSEMIKSIDQAAGEIAALLKENHANLTATIANIRVASEAAKRDLPETLANLRRLSHDLSQLVSTHRAALDQSAALLPKTLKSGKAFFDKGHQAMAEADDILVENRENLMRTIFEFRKTAEHLEELSDDLRRNPWKLMVKKPEIKRSKRARQEKMEEMLLSTGHMDIAPARK